VRRPTVPSRVALQAVGLAASVLAVLLLSGAVEPVELLSAARVGQGSPVILDDFGPRDLRAEDPFDGQYIYVTARLFPDLDAVSEEIYEADYRLVRILHPLLASPAPDGTPLVLLLEAWNLAGVGLFAWAFATMLARHGHDPGWAMGASVAACAIPLLMTTSEPVAFGLGMAGLCLVDRDRLAWAVPLLALAGLTRESALTFAVAAAALAWQHRRRAPAVWLLVASVAPTAAWWAYVQSITSTSRVPLDPLGLLQLGDQTASNVVVSVVTLALIALSVVAWWDVPAFRWLTLAFAAWIPLYESFAFKVQGLPRLSLPSVALGIAGILRWRQERGALRQRELTGELPLR
jgi:hypothetical protein